jgi:hypothetical protein
MLGWMYLQASWESTFYEWDSTEVLQFYDWDVFRCADFCHICITPLYNTFGNTTCKDTVESDLVLYDMMNIEKQADTVLDLAKVDGAQDILVGSNPLRYARNLKDFHVMNYDQNSPWIIPSRGLLFDNNLYLQSN